MAAKSFHRDEFVVAIGASAGGLEAIHDFFDNMPEQSNLSFVVIQHLSPDHKSLLVELVARHTNMKVYEAEHNLQIKKNCIYIIPNNKFITISQNRLILSDKSRLTLPNNAIDVFMSSLAKERREKAIAVVLSGTGTDGTKGIAAIKDAGGLVIAQEPTSSKFDGMPNSAISGGNVDYILPPAEIPQQIVNYLADVNWEEDVSIDDDVLQRIFVEIQTHAGFDFHYYKTPTIVRRVIHRMKKSGFDNIEAYYNFLKNDAGEAKNLGKEFLINVTRFFRDKEPFEVLKRDVFPNIVAAKSSGDQVKLWICACSTGEEVYSLAILLDEVLQEQGIDNLTVKIFATDIEKSNIDIASKGVYPQSIEEDVDENRLKKYFVKGEKDYTIITRIRKQVVFAVHNVIKDPPLIKNDLVSCRNMLIYMNTALQQRVYSVLLFSIVREGYLFLGTTENPNPIRPHLADVSARWKIFKKVSDAKLTPYLVDVGVRLDKGNGKVIADNNDRLKKRRGIAEEFKDALFSDFNFAAFYIDRNFEIKEATGNFDRLLTLPRKTLKLNLLRMLPSSLSTQLITEIKSVWASNQKRMLNNIHLAQEKGSLSLQVLIKPATIDTDYTMVAFHFLDIEKSEPHVLAKDDVSANDYIISLEEELSDTKAHLQHAVEDLETANEELQSTNEELLSSNEELQSSNEELQSLNEELHTLNTEHQLKITELIELNDDLNNYFRSSNIGQIFLDKNMIIRKFNPASARMINFIESDIGRPITHISTNIKYHGLISDIEAVLRYQTTVEREVQLHNGLNLLLRIMPYLRQDQKASGVIISFIDITTITNLNNIIRGVFNSSLSSIVALESERDHKGNVVDFSILAANQAGEKLLSKDVDNLKGLSIKKNLKTPFLDTLFSQFVDVVQNDVQLHTDIFVESEKLWLEVSAVKMMDGLVVTLTDVTQKRNAEERLKKNYIELVSARENLKKLNAELEATVLDRTKLLAASEERFRLVSRATNDAIWDWGLVNNQIWFSDAFYLQFGYDRNEHFDRTTWLAKLHPSDVSEVERSIQHAINTGQKQWTREYRFKKADGDYAHVLDRGYVLQDEYDTPYRMLGSMFDLTALKKAEREVESNISQRKFLAESMPFMVLTADETGAIDFVNSQFESYTGIRQSDALQSGWKRIVHAQDLARLDRLWAESVKYKGDFQDEVRLQLYDGTYHWNLLRAKARKDSDGKVINWVITTVDIHDQKQLNEVLEQKVEERTLQLKKMNEALEVSNNDLQQFASVASHDLQEPLRKIHMYANMISDRYYGVLGGGATYLKKILQSSTRMKSIINNILSYSKLSADDVTFVQTDVNQIINDILIDLEVLIAEKKAEIVVDKFPLVEAVPGQINQVFQNLIGNALKFSKPDVPPVVQIMAEEVNGMVNEDLKGEGPWCKIVIKDNGIGFNEKFANEVFILFQRLHSKDAYEGTGIGLAIAKKIIDKHHGAIYATSVEGEGAIFTIVIPIRQNR
ncbi:chemotaxis protein CheB [Pseudochryseolinea flava]|uniref:Chemotaxis protein n=1 Tax=Pseudochryseolinea flava TaxID=2059302 RepID=A0A364XY33_9BACT|nr:chemotaxis protein CheB [Pseudochryseolinea flava]RAV98712.1 chemotaxis protein [Pseudochryseolinea flava]